MSINLYVTAIHRSANPHSRAERPVTQPRSKRFAKSNSSFTCLQKCIAFAMSKSESLCDMEVDSYGL